LPVKRDGVNQPTMGTGFGGVPFGETARQISDQDGA
jgi:hypothetical protein